MEKERLRRWRAESRENERRYRDLEKLWVLTGVMRPSMDQGTTVPDADALIDRAEADQHDAAPAAAPAEVVANRGGGRRGGARRSRPWKSALKVTAVAAVFILVGLALGTLLDGEEVGPSMLAAGEISTGAGEMTTLTLGDGTSIRLGPRSRLRLSEEGRDRVVWLDGRAFFGVQSDPSRAFTVRTPHGEAVVLGTRFQVRSEEEDFEVLVVDGSVKVSAANVEAELRDGEMSQSHQGQAPSTVRVEDVYAHLEWMGNALVFQETPFRRALDEVARRYGAEVILERSALADLTVTASFTDQELDEVVLVLCEITGVGCSIDDGLVRVGIGPPNPGNRRE